jgi:uncharacterized membrane protein (UPF0127 family)
MLAAMRRFALFLAALFLAACGERDDRPRAVIESSKGEIEVRVEVADEETERMRGLMGRTELDAEAGMVFVFPEAVRGAFWMKDTLIPLSIAFYAADGRILRILDMEPCRQDPCPLYDPDVAYRGALEVNQGSFDRWDVEEGDRIRVEE